jgi:exodeoxyribonuclease V alpha subunit
MAKTTSKMEQITVRVDRVKNTSDSFSAYTAREEGTLLPPRTIKQFYGPVRSQQCWVLAGSEVVDPRWGTQFVAQFAALAAPTNQRDLEAFLTSGLIDGWDWHSAMALNSAMMGNGPQMLAACQTPHILAEIDGITPEMIASLQAAWQRGSGLSAVFAQLGEWGCTSRQSESLVKYYGADVIDRLRENPYVDMLEILYYGWKSADAIGRWLGIAGDDPRRIAAGLETAVHEDTWKAGHTWLYQGQAVMAGAELLNLPQSTVTAQADTAVASAQLIRVDDRIWPESLYAAEGCIAAQIEARLSRPGNLEIADHVHDSFAIMRSDCSGMQSKLIQMALVENLTLLTGGPGTGKTTTLKTLIEAAHEFHMSVTLMAPTGKAAARMTEATGHPASTIHSRLKIVPGNAPKPDSMEPVNGLVIVDEISMLDTSLAAAMLSRISPAAQILLVGDPDQLPSVGPGAVLRDLLTANRIPRVHLDKVYRNEAGIAVNAARMRAGQNILDLPDCQIRSADSPDQALSLILVAVNSNRDALVLTPTNDGPCGRYALNALLQPILNPGKQGTGIVQYAGSTKDPDGTVEKRQEELCLGDKVMVIRNHSELGVFNGQVGTVVDIMVPRSLDVEIDGDVIHFAGEDRRLLTLAYAITGHKAQGSEAPTVIVPVFRSRVLSREWLYTVITRARERCYLIGDVQAIQSCIKVQRAQERRTGLVEAIARTVGA